MATDGSAYYRRNFTLGVINGALINFGLAFFDPATVLPVFVSRLGGSAAMIGLVSAIHGVGWFLPQVFASRLAETRQRLIHLYRGFVVVRTVAFLGAVLAVFTFSPANSQLLLLMFILLLFVAHVAGGFSAIPFLEIMSKTIPVTKRGKFFGLRRLIGGLLGIFAGITVGIILDDPTQRFWVGERAWSALEGVARHVGLTGRVFPNDFGVIFLLGSVIMAIAMLAFCFTGEPASAVKPSSRFMTHLKSGVALMKTNVDFRRFYVVRVCWQFTAMAFPFYVGFAYDELGMPVSLVGLFLAIWVGSGVFSNYFWGRMLDGVGNKIVLFVTAVMSVLPPLIVLVLQTRTAGEDALSTGWGVTLAVSATFFINGMARSGRIITHLTYPLEIAPESDRPLYVGFLNSATFPFMLSPLLGGFIIEAFDTRTLFTVCLVSAVVNAALSLTLREPRKTDI